MNVLMYVSFNYDDLSETLGGLFLPSAPNIHEP